VALAQGNLLVVRQLHFEGNHAFDSYTLSTVIWTTNSSWFARAPVFRGFLGEKRTFNELEFRKDVVRLRVFYQASGFPDVKVDTTVRRTDADVYVTFRIAEGEPIRVSRISVLGLDSVETAWRVRQDLPMAAGDIASRWLVDTTADTLVARLQNRGYPNARVDTQTTVDSLGRRMSVTFRTYPGAQAVFGSIRVIGASAVDSATVAGLVPIQQGDRFRLDELYRAQRALSSSDLFRYALVTIDTARYRPGDAVVPVLASVIEGPAHSARASVGYGTDDCFRVGAGWTARNFLGGGRILDLSGRLSKIGVGSPLGFGAEQNICSRLADDSVGSRLANYALTASIRRNNFHSPDNSVLFTLFGERRSEFMVYLRKEVGASVSLTRVTSSQVPITLAYRVAYGTTEANDVSFCAFFQACVASDIAQLRQRRVQATMSLTVLRQRLNNLLDPTRGSVLQFAATMSSKYFGSSSLQQFTRLVGDASGFLPLSRDVVLAGHVRGGIIFTPKLSLSGGSANFVPPEQRFYAGGPNDVRGYSRNELGPVVYVVSRDSLLAEPPDSFPHSAVRVAPTGGDHVAIANLELRVPSPIAPQRVRFALFADGGALWDRGSTAKFRVTPGLGIRIASPLGPIRLDAAYNEYSLQSGTLYTTTSNGDLSILRPMFTLARPNKWTFHFSVGQAF
jgi:outer membrane protein assembly complex protein YaeT